MKLLKIAYWATTGLVAAMMTFSAYAYIAKPEMKTGFHHLGFPDYFRMELAIAKLLGAIVLLAPVQARFKEWAYAGFGIVFISAFIAHSASGDPAANGTSALVFLALMAVSYVTYHKRLRLTPALK
jgi:uncharacterized membrane protein YphA (DoxX/SURF4 family)